MRTAVAAAASLLAGYAVAASTGVRPLGGVVLLAAAAWCARRWRADAGAPAALGLVAAYALAFALSHPLGRIVGAWPAVLTAALAVGALAAAVAAAPRSGAGSLHP